ncbi:MAG TPA: hypothetical protein VMS96_00825, partial [Terriglobales bacterium]|nr:hypothetical protein [Terriglobales bacterium]
LVLRMGQSHPYTKTLSGVEDGSEIGMVKWEPRLFARLVARAVRNSIFTDNELDRFASTALVRAESQVSLDELKKAR